jgi:hypothetical protein
MSSSQPDPCSIVTVAKIKKLDWSSYGSRRVFTRHVHLGLHHHTNTPISSTLTVTHRRRRQQPLLDVVSRRLHAPHLSAPLHSPRHPFSLFLLFLLFSLCSLFSLFDLVKFITNRSRSTSRTLSRPSSDLIGGGGWVYVPKNNKTSGVTEGGTREGHEGPRK